MITRLEDIKRQAGISLDETTDDDILFELQKSAEDKAETYCGRTFEQATFTEYLNGDGTGRILIYNPPITSITYIYDDLDRAYGADTLLDDDDYTFDAASGIIELDGFSFAVGVKNIKVVYLGGYTAITMPDDLKTAIASLVVADYLEKKGAINAMSEAEMVYRPDKLRKEAYKTLDLYKRYR